MTTNFVQEQKAQNDAVRRKAQRAAFAHPDLRELSRLFASEIEPVMAGRISRSASNSRRRTS